MCHPPASRAASGHRAPDWPGGDIEPLPFIAEIWSPSTGSQEFARKLATYQERGDTEIWHLHPVARTLVRWQREPDSSYAESLIAGGRVQPIALPGVTINFHDLFAF